MKSVFRICGLGTLLGAAAVLVCAALANAAVTPSRDAGASQDGSAPSLSSLPVVEIFDAARHQQPRERIFLRSNEQHLFFRTAAGAGARFSFSVPNNQPALQSFSGGNDQVIEVVIERGGPLYVLAVQGYRAVEWQLRLEQQSGDVADGAPLVISSQGFQP